MRPFGKNWKLLPQYARVASLIALPCSVAVIVLAILWMVLDATVYFIWMEVLMVITLLAETVLYWRSSRRTALVSLFAAGLCAAALLITCFARG